MLMLSKKFKVLSDAFPNNWVAQDDDGSDDDDDVDDDYDDDDDSLSTDECKQSKSSNRGKGREWLVEKIINVRLCDSGVRASKGTSCTPLYLAPTALKIGLTLSSSSRSISLLHDV